MRFSLFILLIALVVVSTNAQFSKKLESLNVDQILKNDRILTNYVKCLLEKGPCTSEGRELKVSLPKVLKSGCDKCNEAEKRNTRKVILHIQDNKPAEWKQLEAKYDPTGEFTKTFRKRIGA